MASVKPVAKPVHFVEAIDYFTSKTRVPTRTWTDLLHAAHTRAFSVAGATSDALLADFQQALVKVIAGGGTLADFRKDFDRIVAQHGWSYRGGRNWRSAIIFNTNVRMAYSAGRWQQAQRLKATRPWLRYVAIDDARTRPEHHAWHNTVLPIDDPWWETHTPPNGWNCRCHFESLSARDLERDGLTPSPRTTKAQNDAELEAREIRVPDGSIERVPTPPGVDTGFGYNPGKSWLEGVTPAELRQPLPAPTVAGPLAGAELPPLPVRPLPEKVSILPAGLTDQAYMDAFLAEFDAVGQAVMWRDASGTRLTISDELFRQRDGQVKVTKNGRERYLPMLAAAIRDPDEIWLTWHEYNDPRGGPSKWVLGRRYLRAWPPLSVAPRGAADPAYGGFAVFEYSQLGWHGITAYPPRRAGLLEGARKGVLLWRRQVAG